jgi:hypothetical protein
MAARLPRDTLTNSGFGCDRARHPVLLLRNRGHIMDYFAILETCGPPVDRKSPRSALGHVNPGDKSRTAEEITIYSRRLSHASDAGFTMWSRVPTTGNPSHIIEARTHRAAEDRQRARH